METTAILLIATPTLFPTIVALGIDPVHFGIILVVNLLIGTLTPPFGVILFIMMDIAKISLAQMSRAVLPFYVPLFLTLMVITYWADFVLAVPRFFGKANWDDAAGCWSINRCGRWNSAGPTASNGRWTRSCR